MPMIMMRTIYNNYCQWKCWRQSWWCSWWWWKVDELNVTFEGNHDEQPPHRLCSHKVGSGRQHQSWIINCISNWNLLLCACCCLDYNSVNSIVQFLCSPFQMISCVTKLWSGQCPVQFTQVGHLGQVGPKPRKDLKKHNPLPNIQAILLTRRSQNWVVSKCIEHFSQTLWEVTSCHFFVSSNNKIFGGKKSSLK